MDKYRVIFDSSDLEFADIFSNDDFQLICRKYEEYFFADYSGVDSISIKIQYYNEFMRNWYDMLVFNAMPNLIQRSLDEKLK